MDPTMDNTKHILNYLMPIIERVNPEVYDFMQQWVYASFCLLFMFALYVCAEAQWSDWSCLVIITMWKNDERCSLFTWVVWDKHLYFLNRAEVGTIFALSWLITWFGHVLSDFRHVVRLYDFFLACHPLMPIYFAAVVRLPLFDSLSSSKPSSESLVSDIQQKWVSSFTATALAAIFRLCCWVWINNWHILSCRDEQ